MNSLFYIYFLSYQSHSPFLSVLAVSIMFSLQHSFIFMAFVYVVLPLVFSLLYVSLCHMFYCYRPFIVSVCVFLLYYSSSCRFCFLFLFYFRSFVFFRRHSFLLLQPLNFSFRLFFSRLPFIVLVCNVSCLVVAAFPSSSSLCLVYAPSMSFHSSLMRQ